MIEEVKKMINEIVKVSSFDSRDAKLHNVDEAAKEICQLFEPKPKKCPYCIEGKVHSPSANMGSIECPKCNGTSIKPPEGRLLTRISEEQTEKVFHKEWRVDFREPLPSRAARNAIAQAQLEADQKVVDALEPKPDAGWAGTLLHLIAWVNRHRFVDGITDMEAISIDEEEDCKFWDNLTANCENIVCEELLDYLRKDQVQWERKMGIKDAECLEGVKAIVREIERTYPAVVTPRVKEWWQALKERCVK